MTTKTYSIVRRVSDGRLAVYVSGGAAHAEAERVNGVYTKATFDRRDIADRFAKEANASSATMRRS